MYGGFKRQEFRPVPKGSNPLWLEKQERASKYRQYCALAALLLIFIGGYYVLTDYVTARDPNASECMLGFVKTGCPEGYRCAGGRVPCVDNSTAFKYGITKMIFPEKKCSAPVIYKELCVPK